jgi:hypothetical protein
VKPYNGHPSYNAWNVALWLANDEGLYRLAIDLIRRSRTRDDAAETLTTILLEASPTTPDGVPWTKTNIRRALVGL